MRGQRQQQWFSRPFGAGLVLGVLLYVAFFSGAAAQDSLEVRSVEHGVDDGQHVIVVTLENLTQDTIEATGEISIRDAGGLEVRRMPVITDRLMPDGLGEMVVPLAEPLPDGRYMLNLALAVGADGTPVHLGQHAFAVDGTPVTRQADDGSGFPSWLLLAGGVLLIVVGFLVGREREKRRRVPDVATIRRVQVRQTPPRRPATIKPLLPPGRRDDL